MRAFVTISSADAGAVWAGAAWGTIAAQAAMAETRRSRMGRKERLRATAVQRVSAKPSRTPPLEFLEIRAHLARFGRQRGLDRLRDRVQRFRVHDRDGNTRGLVDDAAVLDRLAGREHQQIRPRVGGER